ncbi:GlxA family transcriptional regulator [Imbroritus primus]|uniref:GlxA family transcriptional regulator n=1 Tax=Imbroritus primus TaxID=3058603 RepID=A0ACD3SLC9_9BURK|nr:GlxA family transcriptional regulator [Burkholderiaceae bacterium PBA]
MTRTPSSDTAPLRFGIVLLPNFTLTALSGFLDVLRLSSDEGDHSRPVRCTWQVIGETLSPIRASSGVHVSPSARFDDAGQFEYIVVVGGLLHSSPEISPATLEFIRAAGKSEATLVGVCTGAFALMRAGVLNDARICVSWFHYWDFLEQFPHVTPEKLVADRLYVFDHRRITCSGGRASIDVAAAILTRHIDPSIVRKALRILQVEDLDRGNAPQPHPPGLAPATHPKVKRAILLMEQHLSHALTVDELARKLDMSVRQLERLFKEATGSSPQAYAKAIRLRIAGWMLRHSDKTVSAIASSCGFSDASHMGREFRNAYGLSPGAYRAAGSAGDAAGTSSAVPVADGGVPGPGPDDYGEVYPGRTDFY